MRELFELNRYMHDFAAAMWVCGSVLVWLLCREIRRAGPAADAARALGRLAAWLRWLTIPALVVTLASGGVRAAGYSRYEYTGKVTAALVAVLAVKHALYAVAVAWGLWVHLASRRLRRGLGADPSPDGES